MEIPKIWSKIDIEIPKAVIALGFPAIEQYYDQFFGAVSDIEALNWPISNDVILPFLIQAGEKIVPELKRRFAIAFAKQDLDALYCYISRILYYWGRDLVLLFRDELYETIRLGPVDHEEHDAEALFLLRAHAIPLPQDVLLMADEIAHKHPAVAQRYIARQVAETDINKTE